MARKLLTFLFVTVALGASACGSSSSTDSTAPAGSSPSTPAADACAAGSLQTLASGKLTIGTDNPAFFPYFTGGAGHEWTGEFNNDPYTGKGFEDAVAYAVAEKLGFTNDQVSWSVTPFNNSFKPGPKNFDFYLAQVSYSDKRAQNSDLSDSYYDVNQAVVSLKGKPIASATSIADLKGYKLGAQIGTTNFDFITSTIQPSSEPQVYNSTNDAISALKAGQIDGLVTDFPTAYYIANVQLSNGQLVGQFQASAGTPEHFSLVLAKDSPLTTCVNKALTTLRDDGTLAQLQKQWLSDIAQAPVLQ
jgi:polar amino acid transport system substrate-binding protein